MTKLLTPHHGPPDAPGPRKHTYAAMGRANIYKMCEDFYAELERSSLRDAFPQDMKSSSHKIARFFVALFGGPKDGPLIQGPLQLRSRHLGIPITREVADTWLACFKRVLENATEDYAFPADEMPRFIAFLEEYARWLVNRPTSE